MPGTAGPPPKLEGYEAVRPLGRGGFADVFLFKQHRPARDVAVKILHAEVVTPAVRQQFDAEANLMAGLSEHPSIVTVYDMGVADDGRPYIVLEYCSGPSLDQRYRVQRISVGEALRLGVRLASAVETAHRQGILHRDIKPANVLTTAFGWPKLTDFGIAVVTAAADDSSAGLSLPWAAPELIDGRTNGSVATDVYALAATVYTVLAGRSPFAGTTGERPEALVHRIRTAPLRPIGRPDVPASLERALARGLARRPEDRPKTAAGLARVFGQVEAELHLPLTPVEIASDLVDHAPTDEDGATRLRGVVTIDPQIAAPREPQPVDATSARISRPSGVAPEFVDGGDRSIDLARGTSTSATVLRGSASPSVRPPPPVDSTIQRERPAEHAAEPAAEPRSPRRGHRLWAIAGGTVVVLGVGGVLLAMANGDVSPPDAVPSSRPTGTGGAIVGHVPAVDDLAVTTATDESGQPVLHFTWRNPAPDDGDRYLVTLLDPADPTDPVVVDDPEFTTPDSPEDDQCLEVVLRRNTGRTSDPVSVCSEGS